MKHDTKIAAARELALDPITLISAAAMMRNAIAMTAGVPASKVSLSLSSDGNSFDLSIDLAAGDTGERAKTLLETQPPEGLAFHRIDIRPTGRTSLRRTLTAEVVAPGQVIEIAA